MLLKLIDAQRPQHVWQGNAHGTDFLTTPVKRARVGQMPGFPQTDHQRRQHRAHRSRIDPAIGVAADRTVDGTVIHARATTNATQHLVKLVAEHLRAAVIEQHHVELLRPVEIFVPARAGKEAGVARHLLASRASGQQAQNNGDVFERGHDLFYAGCGDVNPR